MPAQIAQRIESFLASGPFAVVGASTNRDKYGNKVLRAYLQKELEVYVVNPNATEVEGLKSYPSLAEVPVSIRSISIITPPAITEKVVRRAAALDVRNVWMQPGAESPEAIRIAEEAGLDVIAGGPCFLVVTGYRE